MSPLVLKGLKSNYCIWDIFSFFFVRCSKRSVKFFKKKSIPLKFISLQATLLQNPSSDRWLSKLHKKKRLLLVSYSLNQYFFQMFERFVDLTTFPLCFPFGILSTRFCSRVKKKKKTLAGDVAWQCGHLLWPFAKWREEETLEGSLILLFLFFVFCFQRTDENNRWCPVNDMRFSAHKSSALNNLSFKFPMFLDKAQWEA